ncbi:transglutaminase-like domain-containing protein [Enterocloster alcoholdehydrogenati]|uniref:Transglutaminase-like domain-containing protein n=1 Tax=Enterocloster alcoholdehydrogenati TaxID=2547410 RepID=A0ABQ0B1B9_9FIRM|nr:transglutaminase-like domain-containing protein [Enterocloster alcoholdehydrogenati]
MIRRSGNKTGTAAVLAAIVIGANGLLGTFPAGAAQTAVIEDGRVPLYSKPAGSYVRTPIASGVTVYKNDKATLDASNISEGYVMVKYTGSVGKIKVQITKSGSETYTYDLNNSGVYEVFPLSEGNGSYQVKVFENIQGNQYSQAFSQSVDASITNTFGPFLYPNQYVNFNSASAAVKKGAEISAGATDQLGVVSAVYNYVVTNLTYDTAKASSVQSGYLPNVDVVLAQKKGICFDYAALMTAMLRSQDIPTKLVVGYTGNLYHAWINVYLDGQGWVDNIIYFDGNSWKLMDPTFASSANQSKEIMQYIGNGANYKAKYSY